MSADKHDIAFIPTKFSSGKRPYKEKAAMYSIYCIHTEYSGLDDAFSISQDLFVESPLPHSMDKCAESTHPMRKNEKSYCFPSWPDSYRAYCSILVDDLYF